MKYLLQCYSGLFLLANYNLQNVKMNYDTVKISIIAYRIHMG